MTHPCPDCGQERFEVVKRLKEDTYYSSQWKFVCAIDCHDCMHYAQGFGRTRVEAVRNARKEIGVVQ